MRDELREAAFNRPTLTVSILPFIWREYVFSVRRGNVLVKVQPSERYFEVTLVFRRAARLCIEFAFGRLGVINTQAS